MPLYEKYATGFTARRLNAMDVLQALGVPGVWPSILVADVTS